MPAKITIKMNTTKASEAIDELMKLKLKADINLFSQAINIVLDGGNE